MSALPQCLTSSWRRFAEVTNFNQDLTLQHSITPQLHYSKTPKLHHSITSLYFFNPGGVGANHLKVKPSALALVA
jgi:hypothetical protein